MPRRRRAVRRAPVNPPPTEPSFGGPLVGTWAAWILAVVYGPLADLAFPDANLWALIFPAIALLLIALRGRRGVHAFGLGTVAGASFYLIHVSWTTTFLGPVPWLALSILQALFVGLGSFLIAEAYRRVPRVWPTAAGRLIVLPAVIAGLWVLREWVSGSWPYDGFAWGRAALSQSESPLASLAAWVGVSGLSFLVVFTTAVIVEALVGGRGVSLGSAFPATRIPPIPRPDRPHSTVDVVRVSDGPSLRWRVVAPALTLIVLVAVPQWTITTAGSIRVGAVQGNGPAGYFQPSDPGDVRDSQFEASLPLVGQDLDLLVWPETAAEFDPAVDAETEAMLGYLSRAVSAPLLVGAVTEQEGQTFNSSLLFESTPDGNRVLGQYDKHRPIPFGEYIPDRAFWEPLAPDLIGLVQREYTPGAGGASLAIGRLTATIAICFDIVDDALIRSSVQDGSSVIIAQTNNADFGTTDENEQQLAIARLRAIESGRSLLNVSTVGTSQAIGPDGATIQSLPAFEPAHMTVDLPLSRTITPALYGAPVIETGVIMFGITTLIGAWIIGRRRTSNH